MKNCSLLKVVCLFVLLPCWLWAQDPGNPDSMYVEVDNQILPFGGGNVTFRIKLNTDNAGAGNDIVGMAVPLYLTSSNPSANPVLDSTVGSAFANSVVSIYDILSTNVATNSGDPSIFPLQYLLGAVTFGPGIDSGTHNFAFVNIHLSDSTTICIDTMSVGDQALELVTSSVASYAPSWNSVCTGISLPYDPSFADSMYVEFDNQILPPSGGNVSFKIKLYTDNTGAGNDIVDLRVPLYISVTNPSANPILDTSSSKTFTGTIVGGFDTLSNTVVTNGGNPSIFPLQYVLRAITTDTGISSGTYDFAFIGLQLSDSTVICIDTLPFGEQTLNFRTSSSLNYTPLWKSWCFKIFIRCDSLDRVDFGTGNGPSWVIASDLDGDGDQDLAACNFGQDDTLLIGKTISVLKNNGDCTFAAKVDYVTGRGPLGIIASDLNGDLKPDLVTANYGNGVYPFPDSTVSVSMNNGDGTFATKVDYTTGERPYSLFAVDLDGDTDRDILVTYPSPNSFYVLRNNGNGTFATKVGYGNTVCGNQSVVASDLDGDTDRDVVVANTDCGSVSVFKNNGDGTFASFADIDFGGGTAPNRLALSDLDGDGDADMAVTLHNPGIVSVLKNDGTGNFSSRVDYSAGSTPISVLALDMDGDGDQDLAIGNRDAQTISVFKNKGNGTFAACGTYAVGSQPYSLFVANLCGGGGLSLATANSAVIARPDFVTSNYIDDNVSVFDNISIDVSNSPPALNSIGPKTISEGNNLTFKVQATDPDVEPIILQAKNLPINSSFVDSGNGAGSFSFNPNFKQAGVYSIKFTASDGILIDDETVNITVVNVCNSKAGDANASGGNANLADIIYLVNYVFKGGSAPSPTCRGDANASGGNANLGDIIYLVNYVFKGGPVPKKSDACCL